MHKHHIYAAFRAAFPVSLPVLAGYIFLGMGYGVLMSKIGYGPVWTALLSIMIYGGTIQYVATSLLAASYNPLNAFVISLMINARHLFYGVSLLERYSGTGWKKPFLAFLLTDETFSLVCSDTVPPGIDSGWFRFFISLLDYSYWIAGGLLGNMAGNVFTFNAKGIEFVMTALFTVVVLGQWRGAKTHVPAVIGILGTVPCLLLFGPGHFLIPSMVLIVAALLYFRPMVEKSSGNGEEEGCR